MSKLIEAYLPILAVTLLITLYFYGEHLKETAISASQLPESTMCEYDRIFSQYVCYEVKS